MFPSKPGSSNAKGASEEYSTPPEKEKERVRYKIVVVKASSIPDSNGSSSLLQRTCFLVVLLLVLHIYLCVVYYMRNSDSRSNNTQNGRAQGSCPGSTSGELDLHSIFTLNITADTYTRTADRSSNTQNGRAEESCPEEPPRLEGPLQVMFMHPISLDLVRSRNTVLQPGGRFKPSDCTARQKVAMIIPFRNQDESLNYWLYYLHPILQRQQLDYGVYIINQEGDEQFNRAKLFNIGYAEALKEYDYDCFVFSDVDLIPMDDRNIYKCYSQPRHLAPLMDKFGFRLPYKQYFGGVSSLSREQFLKINGFPNNYWGWGGEEDDISNRISFRGMSISRPDGFIGMCRMIQHERDKHNDPNPQRFDQISNTRETMVSDGINSLTYNVVKIEKDQLFTKITVDVGKP